MGRTVVSNRLALIHVVWHCNIDGMIAVLVAVVVAAFRTVTMYHYSYGKYYPLAFGRMPYSHWTVVMIHDIDVSAVNDLYYY